MKKDQTINPSDDSLDIADTSNGVAIDTGRVIRNKLISIAIVGLSTMLAYALVALFVAIET